MAERTAPEGYSLLQVTLHWTIAALVIFQLLFNEDVQDAFKDRLDGVGGPPNLGALLHVGLGLLILVLAIVRLVTRFRRGVPEAHATNPWLVNLFGAIAHWALYGFIFLMPLTGAIAWFTGFEFSAELHEIGRLVLIPLIGAHVLGALAEHYVFKTNSLRRMLQAEPPEGGA